MSDPKGRKKKKEKPPHTPTYEPSRKDRLRPIELLVFSGILAVFAALVVLLTTREFLLTGIALGVTFIIALVVLAMLSLGFKPNEAEAKDLDEQNHKDDHT